MNFTPALLWAILGILLLVAEVATTTFVLVFFGMGAFIVALFALLGLHNSVAQILLFATASIVSLLLFRQKLMHLFMAKRQSNPMDKKPSFKLTADVPAHSSAHISYQGTMWTAVNPTDYHFQRDEVAVVERIEGVKLILGRPDREEKEVSPLTLGQS